APEAFTIADHLGDSSAMNRANSCGVPIFGSKPSSLMLAANSADRKLWLISLLSLSRTGAGVPAGASIPIHKVNDSSGRLLSIIVGIAGRSGLRFGLVTASALSLPAWRSGKTVAAV